MSPSHPDLLILAFVVGFLVICVVSNGRQWWPRRDEAPDPVAQWGTSPYRAAGETPEAIATWLVASFAHRVDQHCPKCRVFSLERSTLCKGMRPAGSLACPSREHFHVRCTQCTHRWLMAPADAPEGGEWS